MSDYHWFDIKYDRGEKPTLEDKMELFNQVFIDEGIKIPDRAKRALEKRLQQALFELKRDYHPSSHVIAHSILFCCSPLLELDQQKLQKYMDEYAKLIKKHEGTISFVDNYSGEKFI